MAQLTPRVIATAGAGIVDQIAFGIDTCDLPIIFGLLRNGLYSNKELAVLREYSCNGYDSHVAAKRPNVPIQVTLPTVFEPDLKMRDFGTGLTHDQIVRVFSMYAKSTKRDTDEQIGQLGIGSKSAFCYSDQFTVSSFVDGFLNIYSCEIDDSGLGTISRLGKADIPTNEPNGIEIKVRVIQSDVYKFAQEAKKFFRTFTPRPVILGNDEVRDYLDNYNQDVIIKGADWQLVTHTESYYNACVSIRMGNIVYPFNLEMVDRTEDKQKWILDCRAQELVINAGMGDVLFTASRETLEYKPKTLAFVRGKLEEIYDSMQKQIEDEIATAPNIWTAKQILRNRKSALGHIKFKPNYKGTVLEMLTVDADVLKNHNIVVKKQDHKRRFSASGYAIEPHPDCVLFLDRGTMSDAATKMRVRQYITQHNVKGADYYILCGTETNPADIDGIKAHAELAGANLVEVNEIKLLANPTGKKANAASAQRAKIHVFKWKQTTSHPYAYNWEPAEIDADQEAVFVRIKHFKPTYDSAIVESLDDMKRMIDNYASLDNSGLVIYGVRESVVVPSGWTSLKDYLIAKVNELNKDKKVINARRHAVVAGTMSDLFEKLVPHKEVIGNGKLAKLIEMFESCVAPDEDTERLTQRINKMMRWLRLEATDETAGEFETLHNEVEKEYRLLSLFSNRWNEPNIVDYLPEVRVYIEAVEEGKFLAATDLAVEAAL